MFLRDLSSTELPQFLHITPMKKMKTLTSFVAVCLSLVGTIVPLSAEVEPPDLSTSPIAISNVELSQELATLTKEIDFVYFIAPYQLNIGEQLQRVFTGSADAPYQLELVKCVVFHRPGDTDLPNRCAQVDCRIKVSLKTGSGSEIILEGRGVEIFDTRSPYDVIREALDEAIGSLAKQISAEI